MPELEVVPRHHGMNAFAAALEDLHIEMCANYGMTRWDFCVALANVQARIIASSKDMPEEHALERIDGIRDVIRAVYLERKHGASQGGSA